MLTVREVHTFYGDSHVLNGVTMAVEAGRITALLGRNGVGKTTLCRSIMGLAPPRSGHIDFNGTRVVGWPPHRIAGLRLGLVPQGRRIFSSLSVRENLAIARRSVAGTGWDLSTVFELFPRLAERGANRGNELSGGEQQMLAIARALVANPLLLIMDEPTEGLSPGVAREVAGVIRRLRHEGTSVLLVEQNAAFAVSVADDIHVMSKGTIVHSSPAASLWQNEDVKGQYLGVPRAGITPPLGE